METIDAKVPGAGPGMPIRCRIFGTKFNVRDRRGVPKLWHTDGVVRMESGVQQVYVWTPSRHLPSWQGYVPAGDVKPLDGRTFVAWNVQVNSGGSDDSPPCAVCGRLSCPQHTTKG